MDSGLRPRGDSDSNLCRAQVVTGLIPHQAHEALPSKPAQDVFNGNGPHPSSRLRDRHKRSASQDRSCRSTNASLRHEAHHFGKVSEDALLVTRLPSLPQVLHAKPTSSRRRIGREGTELLANQVRSKFKSRWQSVPTKLRLRLPRVQDLEGTSSCRSLIAEALEEQGIASLALEALTGQSHCKLPPLGSSKGSAPALAWHVAVVPQSSALPVSPAL